MNGRTLLEKVKKEQSYYIEGTYRNEYTGFDVWKLGGIKQDNKIYALAHRGVVDALRNGREIDPQFFIDKATVDEFVEKSTLNTLSSTVTSADDLIVRVLEKAAKPNDKPTTPTKRPRIAINLALLSF